MPAITVTRNRPRPTYDVERTITPTSSKPKPDAQTYKVGDTINHKVFGSGLIISAVSTANDMILEVSFEKVGTKKLMANFLSSSLLK